MPILPFVLYCNLSFFSPSFLSFRRLCSGGGDEEGDEKESRKGRDTPKDEKDTDDDDDEVEDADGGEFRQSFDPEAR